MSRPAGLGARRLVRNLGAAARDALLAPVLLRVPREWLVVRLDRGLAEAGSLPRWLEEALHRPPTLAGVLEGLELACGDRRLRGVLLRPGIAGLGWAGAAALARAVGQLREAGKCVVVYAESAGTAGAWLGALAHRFWMAPGGRLDLLGVRVGVPHLRGLLERLGIRPDVFAAGRYKSAGEILERRSMSPAAREALEEVVEGLHEALLAGLARGRAGGRERARQWIDGGPYLAPQAREIGLVDELVYDDELPRKLAAIAEGGDSPGRVREARPAPLPLYLRAARPRFVWRPLGGGPDVVAVVPVLGTLRAGAGSPSGVVGQLRRLARRREVAAVVLRIDSPGGDPLASDLIWRAVKQLGERKPVVASLGDTAASGGYYVAMAAREIVAEATTLTGSIGVVMLGVQLEDLLGGLGVRFDSVERGLHAGIYDPLRRRTSEDRALLRGQVRQIYRGFVQKAAEDRGLSPAALEKVARGRVWSGEQARAHGLVDRVGGLETAVERARALAGLAPGQGRVEHLPVQPGPVARLLRPDPADQLLRALGEAQLWCPVRASRI